MMIDFKNAFKWISSDNIDSSLADVINSPAPGQSGKDKKIEENS